ncbi:MAG: lytic transglycosylase domain-containing protein [Candidatus Latescibacteria bacterium]|nr:lytic transglycosylase domain-containing protein [Candidatus Latescibacterota bacterium]
MERVERFSRPIRYYSRFFDVDSNLTRAIIWVESRGNPRSISPVGARGLMQLMPRTARVMGVTDSFDANQNIRGGVRYFKNQLNRFGKLEEALWAYNAGPGAVQERRLPAETLAYIRQVLSVRAYLDGQGSKGKQ